MGGKGRCEAATGTAPRLPRPPLPPRPQLFICACILAVAVRGGGHGREGAGEGGGEWGAGLTHGAPWATTYTLLAKPSRSPGPPPPPLLATAHRTHTFCTLLVWLTCVRLGLVGVGRGWVLAAQHSSHFPDVTSLLPMHPCSCTPPPHPPTPMRIEPRPSGGRCRGAAGTHPRCQKVVPHRRPPAGAHRQAVPGAVRGTKHSTPGRPPTYPADTPRHATPCHGMPRAAPCPLRFPRRQPSGGSVALSCAMGRWGGG